MGPHTQSSSPELGALIRSRREELGLSIEQASTTAGIGSETWRRYEAGGSMRTDKVRAVCKALRWRSLPLVGAGSPAEGPDETGEMWDLSADSEAYSLVLARDVSEECARVFAAGFDLLSDGIDQDIESLASMPRGSHIGECGAAWLDWQLPERWLMRYDYEFLFHLRSTVNDLARRAIHPGWDGVPHFTRCVADDLALHLVMEMGLAAFDQDDRITEGDVDRWECDLNGDDDEVIPALYSDDIHPQADDSWHFDNWFDNRYYGPVGDQEGETSPTESPA